MTGEDLSIPDVETGRLRYDDGCPARRYALPEGIKQDQRVGSGLPPRLTPTWRKRQTTPTKCFGLLLAERGS